MRAKKKLIVSMLVVSFVLLSIIATVAIAFALTQQTIKTTLNIGYTVEDIDGTASATFTVGGVTENLTAMKGTQVIGDKLVFKAGDTEDAGNLMFPEDALALSAQNDNVVIQYTYSNTGAKHYIASMDFAANIEADNMKVEYSINGTDYSENRYAVVVPANTSNRSYWIKISIADKAKSASFTGDFEWILNGCDPQGEDYLTIASSEFQAVEGQTGAYSVSLNGEGYLPGGEVVFPSEVNGTPVTAIAQNTSLTQAQKNIINSVYVPDSVTTIGVSAFENFSKMETITFEQNETSSVASVASSTGLKTIGKSAFANCKSLKSINLPNTLTALAYYPKNTASFYGCEKLSNITINTWGSYDILGAVSNIVEENGTCSITLGKYLTNFDPSLLDDGENGLFVPVYVESGNAKYHFANDCVIETSTKTLVYTSNSIIPADGSVTKIGNYAFYCRRNITSIIIPDSITSIGKNAFQSCDMLSSVVLSKNLKIIDDSAFYGCGNLTEIEFPEGLEKISSCAFDFAGLRSVHIPSTTKLDNMVEFGYCPLQTITVAANSPYYKAENNMLLSKDGTYLYYLANMEIAVIPNSVTTIDFLAFESCDSLKEVTIPAGVTTIATQHFLNRENLEKVHFVDPTGWQTYSPEGEIYSPDLTNPANNVGLLRCLMTDLTK